MSFRPSSTRDRSATPGEPYLVHPLEVADQLADMKLDVVAIAAGLLHDIVEDTQTPIERIKELFGADVAHVVEGVTKLGAISVLLERGAAGGELPQDAARHGGRHPRHPRQARRPAAQHAHAPPPAGGAAGQDRAGDPRHLRADCQPARHEQDQERAGGAGVQVPRADGVRGAAHRASRSGAARPRG